MSDFEVLKEFGNYRLVASADSERIYHWEIEFKTTDMLGNEQWELVNPESQNWITALARDLWIEKTFEGNDG